MHKLEEHKELYVSSSAPTISACQSPPPPSPPPPPHDDFEGGSKRDIIPSVFHPLQPDPNIIHIQCYLEVQQQGSQDGSAGKGVSYGD